MFTIEVDALILSHYMSTIYTHHCYKGTNYSKVQKFQLLHILFDEIKYNDFHF